MHFYHKIYINKNILGVIATEIMLIIVIFEASTYKYGKTISSLGNHSGPGHVGNLKLN